MPYRKKLIEVALPLESINKASAREKSIRHGHPSTLHLWWARRPLASCRGVLLALLLPDPCDPHRPSDFKTTARELRNDGLLIYEWSPDILRMELDRYIWSEDRGWEVRLKQLWEHLAQYCYVPRLFDHEVLVKAVKDGMGRLDAPFAYATGKSEEGVHTGLVFRQLGNVYCDDTSIVVHPEHLNVPPLPDSCPRCKNPLPECTCDPLPELCPKCRNPIDECTCEESPKEVLSRYYGRVEIESQRVNKDVGLIV